MEEKAEKGKKQKLLEQRKQLKKKKPDFLRTDAHKLKRLSKRWRKPKGLQNKMRLHKKGYRKSVSKGYKSPALVRGLTKEGLKPVLVSSLKDIAKLTAETTAVLSSTLGLRKKIMVVKELLAKKIPIQNLKDPEAFLKSSEKTVKEQKKQHEEKIKQREEKEKQREKEAKEKEQKEKELKEKESKEEGEDKKQEEKKKIDKILTTKAQ